MFKIGQFSKLAKLSIKTLRYYDSIDLLKPAYVDPVTAYRYYTEEQLEDVRLIIAYKNIGLSVDTVHSLLENKEKERASLVRQKEILLKNKARIERQIADVEKMLADKTKYDAKLIEVDACTVFCCRGYAEDAQSIYAFIRSCTEEFLNSNTGVHFGEPDYCCVIYPDDGFRESDIFIEYVQSVDRMGKDTPTLKFKTLEPILAVSVTHKGDYSNLRDAYLYAVNWAKQNGYTVCAEARERYIAGAWNRSNKEDWITEIQLPVQKTFVLGSKEE